MTPDAERPAPEGRPFECSVLRAHPLSVTVAVIV